MPLTRRRFLKAGTLSALAAGSALGPLQAFGLELPGTNPTHNFQLPSEAGLSPDLFTRETFEPLVGGSFRGASDGRSASLKLLRVSGYDPSARTRLVTGATRATKSFTLTFRAGRSLSPKTSTHQLEHADLGKFSLFMTPYVSPRGHVYYEAVFNRVA
jgi:hypothetical protein